MQKLATSFRSSGNGLRNLPLIVTSSLVAAATRIQKSLGVIRVHQIVRSVAGHHIGKSGDDDRKLPLSVMPRKHQIQGSAAVDVIFCLPLINPEFLFGSSGVRHLQLAHETTRSASPHLQPPQGPVNDQSPSL